jgi:hypothetical protein
MEMMMNLQTVDYQLVTDSSFINYHSSFLQQFLMDVSLDNQTIIKAFLWEYDAFRFIPQTCGTEGVLV